MSVTGHFYDKAVQDLISGSGWNWTADTIKVALLTSSYTPSQGSDHVWSDISANEVSGTGYSAGGATLASAAQSVTSHVLTLSGANVSWTGSTITARYAAIYDTSTSNKLIGYVDFGGNVSSSSATFTITWAGSGILTITMS